MGLFKIDRNYQLPQSREFVPKGQEYDAIIIGAGMSGMAAAIRLAMYDKKVCLLEKHIISGGLNSYYARGKRKMDVGLHALTNFATKNERRKPLTKLLKQLRIPYDELELYEQTESTISFPDKTIRFNNDIDLFKSEVARLFPKEVEGFHQLLDKIENFNEVALDNETVMAKDVVKQYIKNEELLEMIFCPLLIYGSAWENDMDFSQFVIMFKSIYLEGFGRTRGGVRKIIDLLLKRMEEVGVEIIFRNGVSEILTEGERIIGVRTTRGQTLKSPLILSCAGYPETLGLTDLPSNSQEHNQDQSKDQGYPLPRVGRMSFTETMITLNKSPRDLGLDKTIIFHNERDHYCYQRPGELIDPKSAVLCFPNNFSEDDYQEGILRVTMMANYDLWKALDKEDYSLQKEYVLNEAKRVLKIYMPELKESDITFSDVFTPLTVEKFTGHWGGCVYGSPDKSRDGKTPFEGLYLCGTDQGFLGIIGSMLSGISMANLYGLMAQ